MLYSILRRTEQNGRTKWNRKMFSTRQVKLFLLMASATLSASVLVYPFLKDVTLIADWGLYVFFINGISSMLNKFYRTHVFSKRRFKSILFFCFIAFFVIFAISSSATFFPLSFLSPHDTNSFPQISQPMLSFFFWSYALVAFVLSLLCQ